jgi:hypothetical protein
MTSSSFWMRSTVLIIMIALIILLIVKCSNRGTSSPRQEEAFGDDGVNYSSMDSIIKPDVTDEETLVLGTPNAKEERSGVTNSFPMSPELKAAYARSTENVKIAEADEIKPYGADDMNMDDFANISDMTSTEHKVPENPFPSDMVMPEDLLPQDAANSPFSQMNPPVDGSIMDQNFLQSGVNIGIDTKGSTMKNPNYSLRSDYPVTKLSGIPWNNTERDQDLNRKFFEIGAC